MTEVTENPPKNDENVNDANQLNDENDNEFDKNWGFNCEELYKIALKFYKGNESKAFHSSYDDRNSLVSYTLQVKHGKYVPEKASPLGPLDIVGRDRRNAWINLKDLSKEEARKGFIKMLDSLCPLFKPYVKAIKCDIEEKERIRKETEEIERRKYDELKEQEMLEFEAKRKAEEEMKRYDEQKRTIQDALNRQTYQQFKSYAEQQFPGNHEQQLILISQLQEQHYQQYMQQMLQHQLQRTHLQQQNSNSKPQVLNATAQQLLINNSQISNTNVNSQIMHRFTDGGDDLSNDQNNYDGQSGTDSDSDGSSGPITGASMWTRKDIAMFRESIRSEGGDGIIKVGHGEIVTVRVPTHQDGTCIFWEFATESYDIGFGLLFEWTKNPGNQVSVHISESEDEDEEEDDGETEVGNDIEKGGANNDEINLNSHSRGQLEQTQVNVIIPIYRRDSHEEVFAGSHAYPGKGVYLLKFDNSYSLWRSKTLYYRVYYTR